MHNMENKACGHLQINWFIEIVEFEFIALIQKSVISMLEPKNKLQNHHENQKYV